MKFEKRFEEEVAILPLQGKLMGGIETDSLNTQLQGCYANGHRKIVLDFKEVKWINSLGIGTLIKWINILRASGGDLRFTNACGKVNYYLKITKLNTVIKTFDRPKDAINSFCIPVSNNHTSKFSC